MSRFDIPRHMLSGQLREEQSRAIINRDDAGVERATWRDWLTVLLWGAIFVVVVAALEGMHRG